MGRGFLLAFRYISGCGGLILLAIAVLNVPHFGKPPRHSTPLQIQQFEADRRAMEEFSNKAFEASWICAFCWFASFAQPGILSKLVRLPAELESFRAHRTLIP